MGLDPSDHTVRIERSLDSHWAVKDLNQQIMAKDFFFIHILRNILRKKRKLRKFQNKKMTHNTAVSEKLNIEVSVKVLHNMMDSTVFV